LVARDRRKGGWVSPRSLLLGALGSGRCAAGFGRCAEHVPPAGRRPVRDRGQHRRGQVPDRVATVVLASGLNYADALAGAYLAGLGGVQGATGPAGILLTLPDAIPPS